MADRHKPEDAPIGVRFPPELREWLRQQTADGRSRSAVIIEAVAEKRARESANA